MKRKMAITEERLTALAYAEAQNTSSFERLTRLCDERMSHDAGLILAGKLDEQSSSAMAAFRDSIRERSTHKGARTRDLVDAVVDAATELAVYELATRRPSDEELAGALVDVWQETKERLGQILIDDTNPRYGTLEATRKGGGEPEEEEVEDQAEIIVRQSETPPAPPKPTDLFPNTGPEAVIETWKLSETVTQVHCDEETPGATSDDMILLGSYTYPNQSGRLAINPAEKNFDTGTDHFYNTNNQTAPHSRVILQDQGQFLPTFYLSAHVLIESDAWTELAKLLGSIAKGLIENPLSKAANGAAALTGVAGAGAAAAVGGAILDGVLDAGFGGMISGAAQKAHDTVFDLVRKAGVKNNIIFQSWLTGAMIRWVPRFGTPLREPRWKVRHAIGKKSWDAKPRGDNPKRGQGTLRPGHFAGDKDIVLLPAVWNRKRYAKQPTGRYWYVSDITVTRELSR